MKGKAYAVFESREGVKEELPVVRRVIGTPLQLRFYPANDPENMKRFPGLKEYISDAGRTDKLYSLELTSSGSDRKTADETADILNQAYNTHLWKEGEPFVGSIRFEEKGRYFSRN